MISTDWKMIFQELQKVLDASKGNATEEFLSHCLEQINSEESDRGKKLFQLSEKDQDKPDRKSKIICCCYMVELLQYVLNESPQRSKSEDEATRNVSCAKGVAKSNPIPSAGMLSVQELKTIEDAVYCIFYNYLIGCLDAASSLYLKVKMVKEKYLIGEKFHPTDTKSRHKFLTVIFKVLMDLFKHEFIGAGLRTKLLEEYLSILLYLCFSPSLVKNYPEEVTYFRNFLEFILSTVDQLSILKFLLLLKGILSQNHGNCWLKKASHGLFVRRFLLSKNGCGCGCGVRLTVEAALGICGTHDWRKKEAAAALVAQPKVPDERDFMREVCPQIVHLLKEEDLKPDVFQVICFIILQLSERNITMTRELIFKPLVAPLVTMTTKSVSTGEKEEVTDAVSLLHKIYVEVLPPSGQLRPFIEPILCPLMSIAGAPSLCTVKSDASYILVRYLSQLDDSDCLEALFILCGLETSRKSPQIIEETKFPPCGTPKKLSMKYEDYLNEDDPLLKSFVQMLEKLKNPEIVLKFYQKLTSYVDFSTMNEEKIAENFLLTDSEKSMIQYYKMKKILTAVCLISLITDYDQLIQDIFINFADSMKFIKNLLLVGKQKCDDIELVLIKNSLMVNVLMLLVYYVGHRASQKKITTYEWKLLKNILPSLALLQEDSDDPILLNYINQLRNLILTHGVIGQGTTDEVDDSDFVDSSSSSEDDGNCEDDGCTMSKNITSTKEGLVYPTKGYKEALKDLCSPDIPIRGHGILALTRLLQDKDTTALRNKEKVLALLQHHLQEEDSYIYLLAIEGLVTLCDIFPEKVVPALTKEVVRSGHSQEDLAKLYECLTRAASRLGSFLPKYRDQFLNPLLKGVGDPNDAIVVSALSNLGEVCKGLKFSLGIYVQEIFSLLHNKMDVNNSIEIRRAAVLVVAMILQGLESDALKMLGDILPRLYRRLRLVRADADDTLRLQSDVALRELDRIAGDFLAPPKRTLKKKIYVTDVPPPSY